MNKQPINFGSLFSKPDVRDFVASTNEEKFPTGFYLSFMPPVKNQGSVGSCVAHAIATVAEYYNRKETGTFTPMSTGYIYGNRRLTLHKGSGMFTRDALKTMTKYGDVINEDFPINVEVPEAITEFEDCAESLEWAGLNYKFAEYYKLKDENAIKAHLMTGNPVIMSMWWYDDIEMNKGILQTKMKKSYSTSGHCMVIYGWNQYGWKVQNSWGTQWGDKGRFILPYKVKLKEAWGIKDATSNSSLTIKKPFSSTFGKNVAKTLNKILIFFYDIVNKVKETFKKE